MTDDDGPADRAGRQSANRHLHDQHPTTVLLLARHAPGCRPDATAAELTGADDDDDGITITATVPEGTADLPLALPEGPDVRARIGALLKATRAGLPATLPLTSLEEQMAGGGRCPHGSAAGY